MSDTQDGHELRKLIRALVVEYSTAYLSHEGAQKIIELCRAHFQKQAEPVAWKDTMVTEYADGTIEKEPMLLGYEGWEQLPDGTELYTSLPIPADLVMVPREPTEERFKRGVRAFQSGFNGTDNLSDWRAFWQAMIADAPTKEGE